MIALAVYGGLCAVGFASMLFGTIWSITRAVVNGEYSNDEQKSIVYPVVIAISGIFVGVFFAVLANGA